VADVYGASPHIGRGGGSWYTGSAGWWYRVAIESVLGIQADIDLYTDAEVSTRPEMYQCAGDDARGCIFRAKYAGPGLFDYGASSGSTYLGSNITTTSIVFPASYGILVDAGETVHVHLDVRNNSLIDQKVDQDARLYYVPID
jgi:hypothetical protein